MLYRQFILFDEDDDGDEDEHFYYFNYIHFLKQLLNYAIIRATNHTFLLNLIFWNHNSLKYYGNFTKKLL